MANKRRSPNEIDLAVYMERLDTYIITQNNLNETLCKSLDRMNSELDDLRTWRIKIYGAKAVMLFTGILFAHAAVVLGAVAGLIRMRIGV